ncbi:hypothetical protein [Ornithinibacillus californiensis]|uniref:hypothetical protein n=1 Tax=Ornithinibacillus californiensis TaxID=161536 RepID=UPI00064D8FB8|nr:hypothetical protein [Ornithinibacillus californiensis]
MEINFNFPDDIIIIFMSGIVWSVIAYLALRIYKKQIEKPKVWKIAVIIIVSLFSFSINWQMFNTLVKLSILPLGVWAIYVFFKWTGRNWEAYRRFAWLGFWANYLFLASTLLAIPIHHVVYPKDEAATYLSEFENASLVAVHPSAMEDGVLDKDRLKKELQAMKQETIYSDQWYEDTYLNRGEINEKDERFPYQLVNTDAAWGSGLHSVIFVEDDGKGVLITTAENQLYFRFDHSIIEGVE